jgi:hypothetical protein
MKKLENYKRLNEDENDNMLESSHSNLLSISEMSMVGDLLENQKWAVDELFSQN